MPLYVYETIPDSPSAPRRRFEVQQRMSDAPLTRDPETGEAVQRVILGGLGLVGVGPEASAGGDPGPDSGSMRCGPSCGCHP